MNRFKAAYFAFRHPVLVSDGIVTQQLTKKLDGSFAVLASTGTKLQVIPLTYAQRALIRNCCPALKLQK